MGTSKGEKVAPEEQVFTEMDMTPVPFVNNGSLSFLSTY